MMISLVWICIVCFALDEINVSTADELETPSCTIKWVEIPDVYSQGATFQIKETLKSCRDACIQRVQGCTAVDVHGNFTNCFTHTQSLPNLEKNRIPYKGYTQLVLTKECASITLPPSAETTVQSSTKAVQSNPQSSTETDKSGASISQSVPPVDCTEKWKEYKDSFTFTAKFYSAVSGSEACKKACVEEIPGCVAVVYSVAVSVCWYHDEVVDFDKLRKSGKGLYLYVRQDGCENIKPAE